MLRTGVLKMLLRLQRLLEGFEALGFEELVFKSYVWFWVWRTIRSFQRFIVRVVQGQVQGLEIVLFCGSINRHLGFGNSVLWVVLKGFGN